MNKVLLSLSIIAGVMLIGVAIFIIPRYAGIKPVISDPPESIIELIEKYNENNPPASTTTPTPLPPSVSGIPPTNTISAPVKNTTGFPLVLPEGFSIEVFAKNAPGARVMAFDSKGDLWVSRMSKGIVTMYDVENGKVVGQKDVFKNLKNPHGLAFRHDDNGDADILYIAEEDKISTAIVRRNDISAVQGTNVAKMTDIEKVDLSLAVSSLIQPNKIKDLTPSNTAARHKSRTISFGPDGRLYVSIGSSCDVCTESTDLPAKIFSMKFDGSDWREEARGLRNSVFFTWSFVDGRMWATDMGRDRLGDNLPPDEINIIERGKNYGWPICYGKNVHDTSFDKNTYIRNPCMEPFETESHVDLPAHVAPLGLTFIPEEGWPKKYWYNLLVSYHGSWNSTKPVGYKVARIILDAKGNVKGTEDFLTGFLTKDNKALGRPVDIMAQPGGVVYISDDHAGVIYRVWYNGK